MTHTKEILRQTPWSPDTFLRALQDAAKQVKTPDGVSAALEIAIVLSEYLAQLQTYGKASEIRDYSQMLHTFLLRHPKLKRLRDLDPADQFAIRIDTLFQQLFAMQRVTTTATAREVLSTDTRKKILEALVDANDWLTTPQLVERCGLSSRQHLHQSLGPLREAGLVQSTAGATNRHAATLLGHQIWREMKETAAQRKPQRSLLRQITERERLSPSSTGIEPPLESMSRRS